MKKLASMLLVLTLCFSAFSANAFADGEVFSHGYFYYTVADKSITIVGYFGDETEVTVPSMIAGIPVNEIAPGAFDGTTVQVVHLPDTVTTVPEDAGENTRIYADQEQTLPAQSEQQTNTTSPVSSSSEESIIVDGEDLPGASDAEILNPGAAVAEQVTVEDPSADTEPSPSPTAAPSSTDKQTPAAKPDLENAAKDEAVNESTAEAESDLDTTDSVNIVPVIVVLAVAVCAVIAYAFLRKNAKKGSRAK